MQLDQVGEEVAGLLRLMRANDQLTGRRLHVFELRFRAQPSLLKSHCALRFVQFQSGRFCSEAISYTERVKGIEPFLGPSRIFAKTTLQHCE